VRVCAQLSACMHVL